MEQVKTWLLKAEETLDSYGQWAWIAAMVGGFVVFLPLGLVLLGYMIWSGRMGCKRGSRKAWRRNAAAETGNEAFDAYRRETLTRLEEEREAFVSFMERLRKAKDQAEFDQFLRERRGEGGFSSGGPGSGGVDPQPMNPQPMNPQPMGSQPMNPQLA